MKRFNPFYVLAFMAGYFVSGMAFMLSIPQSSVSATPSGSRIMVYRPGEIMMRAAWHRDHCAKRSDGYLFDRKLYFGNRAACEAYQQEQRHPIPPSAHHWTEPDTSIVLACTKDGETGCANVMCYGRNLVEGCPGYEGPPLEDDQIMRGLSLVVAEQLCADRPVVSVWIRNRTKWQVVPCATLKEAVREVEEEKSGRRL